MTCRYTLVGALGQGSFGKVFRVIDRNDGQEYALKTAELDLCQTTLMNFPECDIHFRLVHPFLMPALDIFRDDDGICPVGAPAAVVKQGILLPLMDYDLEKVIKTLVPGFDALRTAWQITCAVEALHAAGYAHLDIKPANILQKGETSYVSDPGLAISTSVPEMKYLAATPYYRAPEIDGTHYVSDYMAIDVYSLGITYIRLADRDKQFKWPPYDPANEAALNFAVQKAAQSVCDAYIQHPYPFPDYLKLGARGVADFFQLCKEMVGPLLRPSLSSVRKRLEQLWPGHPPAPVLQQKQNLRQNPELPGTRAYIKAMANVYIPRAPPRLVEHTLWLLRSVLALPELDRTNTRPHASGFPTWLVQYMHACFYIAATFYTYVDLSTLTPQNVDVCSALKTITWSKELLGRFNTTLPGEPPIAAATTAAARPLSPLSVVVEPVMQRRVSPRGSPMQMDTPPPPVRTHQIKIPNETLYKIVNLSKTLTNECCGVFTARSGTDVFDNPLRVEPPEEWGLKPRNWKASLYTVFVGTSESAPALTATPDALLFHTHPSSTYKAYAMGSELSSDFPSREDLIALFYPYRNIMLMLSAHGIFVYMLTEEMNTLYHTATPGKQNAIMNSVYDTLQKILLDLRWTASPKLNPDRMRLDQTPRARARELADRFNALLLSDMVPGAPAIHVFRIDIYAVPTTPGYLTLKAY